MSFDDVLLRELDDLVTLWPKVLALLRVEPSLRLLDAFPLRDADTLGRITQNGGDLVADDKGAPGLLRGRWLSWKQGRESITVWYSGLREGDVYY